MGAYDQTIHLLNFIAPAWGLACLTALVARFAPHAWFPSSPWRLLTQVLLNGVMGMIVLSVGLYVWNTDGKMFTYAALVLSSSTTQWLLCRGWRQA